MTSGKTKLLRIEVGLVNFVSLSLGELEEGPTAKRPHWGELGPLIWLPWGMPGAPPHPDQGCSPQDDEFTILDGLLAWLRIFTRRREDARALVSRAPEV